MLVFIMVPITLLAISWVAYVVSDKYLLHYDLMAGITFAVFLLSLSLSLLSSIAVPFYYGAGLKAEMINAVYGTSYTREQMFFASDIIDTVREIKRQRVELNGNLMRQESD